MDAFFFKCRNRTGSETLGNGDPATAGPLLQHFTLIRLSFHLVRCSRLAMSRVCRALGQTNLSLPLGETDAKRQRGQLSEGSL